MLKTPPKSDYAICVHWDKWKLDTLDIGLLVDGWSHNGLNLDVFHEHQLYRGSKQSCLADLGLALVFIVKWESAFCGINLRYFMIFSCCTYLFSQIWFFLTSGQGVMNT